MNTEVNGGSLTITGRLRVQIQVVDDATGDPLIIAAEVALEPGDTVTWTYPAEGLVLTMG